MKKLFLLAAAILLFGTANAKSDLQIKLPAVSSIEASGNIIMKVSKGDSNTLTAAMRDDVSRNFTWNIKDNALSVKFKPSSKKEVQSVVLYLTFTDATHFSALNGASILTEERLDTTILSLRADGQSTISLEADAKVVTVNCSNKSRVILTGKCEYLTIRSRYSGTVNAGKMEAGIVSAEAIINSVSLVNATEILVANTASNGTLKYTEGTPVILISGANVSVLKERETAL